jgi:glyoxalase family protein
MQHPIRGLHHVTATVAGAQEDLDFCLEVLGLRLVKKTVNFDNAGVYHFYYGDERGTPGTIWTTFPYRDQGIPAGVSGNGQIAVTSLSVPAGSLDRWRARLREHNVTVEDPSPRFGTESIIARDPSGLAIELVANHDDARTPWTAGGVAAESAIRGLHGVTLKVDSPDRTVGLMTGLLGFKVTDEMQGRTRLGVNGGGPGKTVELVHGTPAGPAKNGLGTVHHVAMAIGGEEEQLALRKELARRGYRVTEVLDRLYFRSIYFREPAGVLFEVATVAPGFTVDEDLASLGSSLKLPPWEESKRAEVEAQLPVVSYRTPAVTG